VLGHRGHRMALPAWCRRLCGSWPRGQGPPAQLPALRAADGLLARLSALGALWPRPADLGSAGDLPGLSGESCAAAGVRAGAAAGRGRGDRCGAGLGGGWPWDAADRCLAGRAPLDRAGLASAVSCSCPHPGRWPCRPGGRAHRERPGTADRLRGCRAGGAGGGLGLGGGAAGGDHAGRVAAGRADQRRGVAFDHHTPPWAGLGGRRFLPPMP
jgi:hypothetical protein